MKKTDGCKGLLGLLLGHRWRYVETNRTYYAANENIPYGMEAASYELRCTRCGKRWDFGTTVKLL